MRKQTKLAVVLAAAALLAVGSASIVSAAGWVQEGAEWRYQDNSGDYVTETMKKSGDTTFYLDENGYMAKDYFCNYNENYYYFGSNGAMVKNTWVAIDPSLVDNADEDADACWFYFQDTGKAYKASDGVKKKKIDGKTYFFDVNGQMMTGWFDGSGETYDPTESNDFLTEMEEMYFCGEDGVARSGWLAYTDGLTEDAYSTYTSFTDDEKNNLSDRTTLYFYFNTSNFKRVYDKEKTINGKKYRFDLNGVMTVGWEYLESNDEFDPASTSTNKYYSGEDDGHLVKKGWVYTVPSQVLDSEKWWDDEEAYFYFTNSGSMVSGIQKRINGKYYVFNPNGLMKTGLVILNSVNEYQDKLDLEYTDGSDFIKKGIYYTGSDKTADIGKFSTEAGDDNKEFLHKAGTPYSIHYYGTDGAKMTGAKINVEFADDTYTFAAKNKGGYVTKTKSKFYSNGFLLKASDDIRLGLVMASDTEARKAYKSSTINDGKGYAGYGAVSFPGGGTKKEGTSKACYVVTTSGSQKKGGAYKDADGNYWLVNKDKMLVGIYNVQVKWQNGVPEWKCDLSKQDTSKKQGTKTVSGGTDGKDDVYINFDQTDKTGTLTQDDHLVTINSDYCLNFYIDEEDGI